MKFKDWAFFGAVILVIVAVLGFSIWYNNLPHFECEREHEAGYWLVYVYVGEHTETRISYDMFTKSYHTSTVTVQDYEWQRGERMDGEDYAKYCGG